MPRRSSTTGRFVKSGTKRRKKRSRAKAVGCHEVIQCRSRSGKFTKRKGRSRRGKGRKSHAGRNALGQFA